MPFASNDDNQTHSNVHANAIPGPSRLLADVAVQPNAEIPRIGQAQSNVNATVANQQTNDPVRGLCFITTILFM